MATSNVAFDSESDIEWYHTLSLLPRRCEITGESLFLKPAYQAIDYFGYDFGDKRTYWHSEQGHMLYLLQEEK